MLKQTLHIQGNGETQWYMLWHGYTTETRIDYLCHLICSLHILFSFSFQSIRLLQWHSEMPDYAYHLLLGLYLPIVIFGSILNTILLLVILTTPKLRIDPRNSFIVALAVSDFFLCNFTSPLTLWSTLEGHWPLGPR